MAEIIRAGHAAFRVRDLAAARAFYVDALGFTVTAETPDALYLRGIEERCHHSLVLRRTDGTPCADHIAFRVAGEADLERLERLFRAQGLPTRRVAAGEEPGQGPALRAQDPAGLPVEFYSEMAQVPWMLQQFHRHHGACIQRIDHFNCLVPDVQAAYDWWTGALGFRCSEYTAMDAPDNRLWAAWLYRKPNVHDIALMNGAGPRVHHAGFHVADATAVLRACDVLAAMGYAGAIERGPGRHGLSNAFFLYLRDPDGHRIELYTGDYLTADPDTPSVRWSVNDPRRQTFWGAAAPRSWFDEASAVVSLADGGLVEATPPLLQARPQHVT